MSPQPCNVKPAASGRRSDKGFSTKMSGMAILLIVIAGAGGFGVGVLASETNFFTETIGGAIGDVSNRDSLKVGDWFRYEYLHPTNGYTGKYFVLATVAAITTAGAGGDPVLATLLGNAAKDYKWNITVHVKASNLTVTLAQVKADTSSNILDYQYCRILVEGYANRGSATIDTFKTSTNSTFTARPIFAPQSKLVYSALCVSGGGCWIYGWKYTGGNAMGYYILNKPCMAISASQVSYEVDTGILLNAALAGYVGFTSSYGQGGLFLVASNVYKAGVPQAPAAPVLTLANGENNYTKVVSVSNFDAAATYFSMISVIYYQNGSIAKNQNQAFTLGKVSISFSKVPAIYHLSVKVTATKSGIQNTTETHFANVSFGAPGAGFIVSKFSDFKPTDVTPATMNTTAPTLPATPTVTVVNNSVVQITPASNVTNYTIFVDSPLSYPVDIVVVNLVGNATTNVSLEEYIGNGDYVFNVTATDINGGESNSTGSETAGVDAERAKLGGIMTPEETVPFDPLVVMFVVVAIIAISGGVFIFFWMKNKGMIKLPAKR